MASTWGSSRLMIGMIIKNGNTPETAHLTEYLVSIYEGHYETLLTFLLIIYVLNSILFVFTILQGRTFYPKWMAFLNPALLILFFYSIYIFAPSFGKYIYPSTIHIVYFIILSTSTWVIYQHRLKERAQEALESPSSIQ